MSEENEAPVPVPVPVPSFDPTVHQRAFDKSTVTGATAMSGTGDIIPRKRVTFTLDVKELAPGIFADDIQITLLAPTSAMEISATESTVNPGAVGVITIKGSIEKLNGAPVPVDQVDFLWEALGPGGRQIAATMFAKIGSLTPAGMGKAEASCTVR